MSPNITSESDVPSGTILPEPLPAELQEWLYLPVELFRKPWEHFAPFLAAHGYILAHTPEYDQQDTLTFEPGQPPIPFQSTFDFRFAFIDFDCSFRFPPDTPHHLLRNTGLLNLPLLSSTTPLSHMICLLLMCLILLKCFSTNWI